MRFLPVALLVLQAVHAGKTVTAQDFTISTPDSVDELRRLEAAVSRTAAQIRASVIAVQPAVGERAAQIASADNVVRAARFGSGVMITASGLAVSQHHVSHLRASGQSPRKSGDSCRVANAAGEMFDVQLLESIDSAEFPHDISAFQIPNPRNMSHAPLTQDGQVTLGEWVLKLGYPRGLIPGRGPVVRLGRVVRASEQVAQTDARIENGDSGGPYFNLHGQLVGLHGSGTLVDETTPATQRHSGPRAFITARTLVDYLPTLVDASNGAPKTVKSPKQHLGSVLPDELWSQGTKTLEAWNQIGRRFRGAVVELLHDDDRCAYGTVVHADGWVVSKASELRSELQARLSDRTLTAVRLHRIDIPNDLALLKLDDVRGIAAIAWAKTKAAPPGTFVATVDETSAVVAAGVVSTFPYEVVGWKGPLIIATPRNQYTPNKRRDGFPHSFEHDLPLTAIECGGPIFNLDGEAIGITIARVGDCGCAALPAGIVQDILRTLMP